MAFPREKISSTSLHLWVSDTNGGIHVLCHVNTEATSSSSQDMKWREVEENSDYHQLVGGASDVILGVDCSDKELFVRDKVSYSEPLGKKWLPTGCHVTHTAVGKQYIGVIIHEERRALIGTISLVRGSHFCPIKWEEISGDIPRDLAYITMTTDDVLYGITVGGVVYGCYGIRELTRPLIWEFLSKPPVPARKGFLSSLFGTTPTTIFDHVTSNGKGVWCYSQRNSEIWLLNIYEKPNKTHNTNWTRFNLPSSTPKLISITCNPMGGTNETTLYGISEDGHGLYELIPIGNKIDIFELPFHGYGDITMTTVTCSLLMKKEEKEVKTIPSLYPKLPKLSPEKGLCCENGTCSFCLGRSSLTSVSTETTSTWGTTAMTGVTSTSLISPGYTKDLYTVDNYRQQIKDFRRGQRSHSPSLEGAKKAKEGNDFEYLSSPRQATPTTARKRRSHSITQRLVRDIPVVVTTSTSAERVVPKRIDVPLISLDTVNDKFVHSFELEESILISPLPPPSPSLPPAPPSLGPTYLAPIIPPSPLIGSFPPPLSHPSPSSLINNNNPPQPQSPSLSQHPSSSHIINPSPPPPLSPLPIVDHQHTPPPSSHRAGTHSQVASPEESEGSNSQLVIGFEQFKTNYMTAKSH